jgi:peptidoglycan/xylan/chitin deacetylase (PgdA/CDA1 family)
MTKRKVTIIGGAVILILLALTAILTVRASTANREPAPVAIRVDDIQDFAFREAQLFLLKESQQENVPLTLAVIAGAFGRDQELVQATRKAISPGCGCAGVHGWQHEDLSQLALEQQTLLLSQAQNRIRQLLDYDTRILIPPLYNANEDTIRAMHADNYTIISTFAGLAEPKSISSVTNLPATVAMSTYTNGVWTMKSAEAIKLEMKQSVDQYGLAVIVTHPQEFLAGEKLNPEKTEIFRALLQTLKQDYTLRTLDTLRP